MQGYQFRNLQNLDKSWHVQICCCASSFQLDFSLRQGPQFSFHHRFHPETVSRLVCRSPLPFDVCRHLHFPACFWTMDPKLWGIQYSYLYLRKKSEKEKIYQILLSISQPQIFEQQDGLQPKSSASNCQAKMGLVSPDQRTFTKEQYMGRLSAGGSQIHVGQGFRPLGPFASKNIMGWVWRFCWENKRCVFRSY